MSTLIRQIYVNELGGMPINVGDPMPYPIPMVVGVGKNPRVTVEKVVAMGSTPEMPLMYPSFDRNAEGYVTRIWINGYSIDGKAVEDYLVYVTPQQFINI